MSLFVDLTLQGIINGSIYALIAVGLVMVYGLLRVLHIAHAGLFTLGGYLSLTLANATGSLAFALLVSTVLVGCAGMLVYRLCYEPILHRPPFVVLIVSVGLFIALEEAFRLVFGPYGLSYANPPLQERIEFLGLSAKVAELAVIGAVLVLFVTLDLLTKRTRLGLASRATVTEPAMAASFGVNVALIRYLAFFIGSAFAAVAGTLVSILNNIAEPTMGSVPSYKALAVIVLGGIGQIWGTLAASLFLGVVESFGTVYLGTFLDRDAIAFTVLLLVLMFRPAGLLGR